MIRRRDRRGFTLIELLVVMSGLAVAIGFGVMLLSSLMRIDQMAAANLHRLMRHYELADLFREDVAYAIEVPDRLGELVAISQCLILRQASDTWVIYQFNGSKLERLKRMGDKESRRPIALGSAECQVEFDRGNEIRPVVTIRITETTARGFPRRIDISAALKGELK
jgi:prepilin-type N-terminal cleavage/methylation domain-containing protein